MTEPLQGVNVGSIDWHSDAIRQTLPNLYTEDVELRTLESGTGTGLDPRYVGADGVAEYLQSWLEPFDEYYVEYLDYIEAGDFVLVPTHQWGIGSTSGVRAELDLVWVYELRDGKIARAFQYDTLEQAREAVAQLRHSG